MQTEPILVIMAAGMGSRYGGLKQIDPVGEKGELIIDFSIFDAIRAGFKKVVFIIKKQNEADFKEAIGNRISKYIETSYVYQEIDKIPGGYEEVLDGRVKPWGTGHAILCCKEVIDAPFAVINADDYYGYEAFEKIYHFLKHAKDTDHYQYAMVGYTLNNTLTKHGHVARGICDVEDGVLKTICERTHIAYHNEQVQYLEKEQWIPVKEDSIVSMNLWGFTPSILNELEKGFKVFLDCIKTKDRLKEEYFLPTVVDGLIQEHKASVQVLCSNSRWYGVTYKEDKHVVVEAIQVFKNKGLYPEHLWGGEVVPNLANYEALKVICEQFKFEGEVESIEVTGNGHINDTFLVTTVLGKEYILQRINHHIFKNPVKLMENITKVCEHISQKVKEENGDLLREVLAVIPSKNGEGCSQDDAGYYWRAYGYIGNTVSYDIVPDNTVFYNCAKAFGKFQKQLADFDASKLYETIKDFHHTPKRFEAFLRSVEKDTMGRASIVKDEIEFLKNHEQDTKLLLELYEGGKIPLRVTHNDTKINNILVDAKTNRGLCVIDLDTVMPGLAAYDFGDAIRTGATSGAEDEKDLNKVQFMPERFEAFAKGFLEEVGGHFNREEIYSLLIGAKLMTLEVGMRFLTDYLDGDCYFKIHREHHNLDRARTQFKLVQDMEEQWDTLETIIKQFM